MGCTPMKKPIIALLTDFGLGDTYVASMKGVILGICPHACLVDVCHLVPPQDVGSGAFLLASVWRDFPVGTIHLAVVDPGVGTERPGLVLGADGYLFVGPDNGLFSWIWREAKVREAYRLERSDLWRTPLSRTFHGRDIFAPAAAHLSRGMPAAAFGPPCTPHLAAWTDPVEMEHEIIGQIIHIDHFGNAVSNIPSEALDRLAPRSQLSVRVAGLTLFPIMDTYAHGEPGCPIALIGSSNRLEIAVNRGHAARSHGLRQGDPIRVVDG